LGFISSLIFLTSVIYLLHIYFRQRRIPSETLMRSVIPVQTLSSQHLRTVSTFYQLVSIVLIKDESHMVSCARSGRPKTLLQASNDLLDAW
jgi:hypothetical protein